MCDPVTAAVVATLVVSGASAYSNQKQANTVFKQNQANALAAQKDSLADQAVQSNQRRDAAGQQSVQNTIAGARARAAAVAASSDANVSGLSIDALINDATRQEATNATNIAANQTYAEEQRYRDAQSLATQTKGRIGKPAYSNPILTLLQIGGSATSAGAGASG